MRALLIFDQEVDLEKLKKKIDLLKPSYISLFSLTSQWRLIRDIEDLCQLNSHARIELMESARLIDKEVDILRQRISKWSAKLSNSEVAGKSIKEWFLLPKGEVSTWWFSLLSEKNPLKTDVFLNVAQLQAIDKIISSKTFDLCIFSVCERQLSIAIEMLCKRYDIRIMCLVFLKRKGSLIKKIKSYFDRKNIFNLTLKTLICLRTSIFKVIKAKLVMGSIKNRLNLSRDSILFVSYFPLVDKKSAEEGILKNKYAIALQEKLAQMEKKIIWVWMYISLDGYSFRDALKLAKKFANNGETNFFIEEFLSLKVLLRALFSWLRQVKIFFKLKKKIPQQFFYKNLSISEASGLIKDLMMESFVGWIGLEGILYFELFKEIFSHFPYPIKCIYYSEMHAWEHALNSAKALKAPHLKTVGFMHTDIPLQYFPYFHHIKEIDVIPLPDILACNGDISFNRMHKCGYPNIRKVEAIRHSYLIDYLGNLNFSNKENIVLIAGSIDKQETEALISLFYEAFPIPKGFKVWLKGHPSMPLEQILKELTINPDRSEYIVKHDSINELIKAASIIFVGSSSVGLEALAGGCKVTLPVFADNMFMNALGEFQQFCTKVYNPEQLRKVIEKIMESGWKEKEDMHDIMDFISNYWCLDKSLHRWEEILS